MSIIEQIKALEVPVGELNKEGLATEWGEWSEVKRADCILKKDLKSLAESHERLLKIALRSAGHWESLRPIYVVPESLIAELQSAIEQAEKVSV